MSAYKRGEEIGNQVSRGPPNPQVRPDCTKCSARTVSKPLCVSNRCAPVRNPNTAAERAFRVRSPA